MKNINAVKTWVKRLIVIFSIITSIYMILIRIISSSYSVLGADDFSHGLAIGVSHISFGKYLMAAFHYACKTYLTWQGTYFAMFLQALLSPINNYGMSQLRIIMIVNTVLLFASLIYFIIVVCKKNGINDLYIKLLLVTICIIPFCGFETYIEVFFWFSGATSYSFPLSLMFLAFALYIQLDANKMAFMVIAGVCGFLAMGGTLAIAGAGCFAALLVLLYKFDIKKLIIFIIWTIGAFINALAPGNYVRQATYNTGLHPYQGLKSAIMIVNLRYQHLLSYCFALLLLITAAIGMFLVYKGNTVSCRKLVFALVGLITPFVTAFPITFGYGNEILPDRCAFIIDVMIVLTSLYFAFNVGMFISLLVEKDLIKLLVIFTLGLAMACNLMDSYGLEDFKSYEISRELQSGLYKEHYEVCKDFLAKLETYPKGDDVRIPFEEYPFTIDNIQNFYLSDAPDNWVNVGIAQWYGFNSIAVLPQEE